MPIPPSFPPSNHPAPFRLANDLLLRRTVGRRQRRAASILAVSSSHLCHVRGVCEMANHPRTIQNHPNMVVLCGFKWQIIQKCWCEKSENPLVFSVRHEKRTPPFLWSKKWVKMEDVRPHGHQTKKLFNQLWDGMNGGTYFWTNPNWSDF